MSAQRFPKLEEALESLNCLDSGEIDFKIAVLPPDASERIDEDVGDENEVNTGEIIVKYAPESFETFFNDRHFSTWSSKGEDIPQTLILTPVALCVETKQMRSDHAFLFLPTVV
ncbi:hypothetical protein TNCV_2828151 [Trichonephila clavipes]|nr:hypothetical protein TNCV_2828151 [Trichonephila clavipes]